MNYLRNRLFTIIVCITSTLCCASLAHAQAPDTLWTRTYGGPDHDEGFSVQQTADGGYVITGYTCSYGAGGYDVYLIKTDSLGDTLWVRTYGGDRWEESYSVQQTIDGGYIIAGYTESFGTGVDEDVYLIKTDSSGDILWTKTYGGPGNDEARSVQQTADSGYVVVGNRDMSDDHFDIWLLRTDKNGDTLWTKTYGTTGYNQVAYSAQCTIDGGYIITGYTEVFESGSFYLYVWLLKTDDNGDTLWTKIYRKPYLRIGRAVQQTADRGYVILADVGFHFCLIKTDSLGDTLWTKRYSEGIDSYGSSVQQTADGGYIIAGIINLPYVIYEAYLIKTDAHGETLWTKTYGDVDWGWDFGWSVQQTRDGGYIVVGSTMSYGVGGSDVWLLKIAPDTLGIEERKHSRIVSASLLINPNPFREKTHVRYEMPQGVDSRQESAPSPWDESPRPADGIGSIQIYDITGRLVRQWDYPTMRLSDHIIWDGTDTNGWALPSGVYFVRFEADDYKTTQKLLFVK